MCFVRIISLSAAVTVMRTVMHQSHKQESYVGIIKYSYSAVVSNAATRQNVKASVRYELHSPHFALSSLSVIDREKLVEDVIDS